jgi:hypothetical protein
MPYTSRMAQERARWMTLREALAHIEKAELCSLKDAWRQLREAIADREIDARWPHALQLTRVGDYDDEDIGPSRDIRFWKSARYILGGGGRILDDPACRPNHARLKLIREGKLHYRSVLVRKDDVERVWPTANGTAEARPPTASLSHGTEPFRPTSARPKYSEVDIRKEIKRIYGDQSYNRPNLEKLYYIVSDKFPGVSRSIVRRIGKEPEFSPERRPAGNQPKN